MTSEPTLLMALCAGRAEHTPEAEPVLITRVGDTATLTRHDGETLSLSATELQRALAA